MFFRLYSYILLQCIIKVIPFSWKWFLNFRGRNVLCSMPSSQREYVVQVTIIVAQSFSISLKRWQSSNYSFVIIGFRIPMFPTEDFSWTWRFFTWLEKYYLINLWIVGEKHYYKSYSEVCLHMHIFLPQVICRKIWRELLLAMYSRLVFVDILKNTPELLRMVDGIIMTEVPPMLNK